MTMPKYLIYECGTPRIEGDDMVVPLKEITLDDLCAREELAPLYHGHWEQAETDAQGRKWKCSVCRMRSLEDTFRCPHCGSVMGIGDPEDE